ncbi:hypothetical protein Dcar01_00987 [Deinococcus carri]|uniref:Lipoprotein n=2 Tax=Deinococcus carri TaxID=1211323 RepID=A0ABP9W8E5_9DEIO
MTMRLLLLIVPALVCGCKTQVQSEDRRAVTVNVQEQTAAKPLAREAEQAVGELIAGVKASTLAGLQAEYPSQDPGRHALMLATIQDRNYQLKPELHSEGGETSTWGVRVHRASAQPFLNAQAIQAAATRIGSATMGTPQVTAEKNRHAATQIRAGAAPYVDLFVPVTFTHQGGKWAVLRTPQLIGNLTQP